MRSRSVGILADNMDDYLSQLKQTEETYDNDFIKYQLQNNNQKNNNPSTKTNSF